MKNILLILIIIVLFSCKTQKKTTLESKVVSKASQIENLTELEIKIVNDFLDLELKKDNYKSYKNYQYVIIEEALKTITPLNAYEHTYINLFKWDKKNNDYWVLDSLEIKEMKNKLLNEKQYNWKTSNFSKIEVNLLKYEELRKIIKSGEYISLPHRLIIFLSKPLIIDENNALLSFNINNGDLGSSNISHFTVLMKRINNKWEENGYYDDGVYY